MTEGVGETRLLSPLPQFWGQYTRTSPFGPRFTILGRVGNDFQCSPRHGVHYDPAGSLLQHIIPLLCPTSPNPQPLPGRRDITPRRCEFDLHNTYTISPSHSRDPVHLLPHR